MVRVGVLSYTVSYTHLDVYKRQGRGHREERRELRRRNRKDDRQQIIKQKVRQSKDCLVFYAVNNYKGCRIQRRSKSKNRRAAICSK